VLAWEIFGDDLIWMEVYACVAFSASVGVWLFFKKIPVSLISLLICIFMLVAGAFRPIYYNSDTENYFSYVYFLRFVSGADIFFLTKLEPVHSALILILKDFRLWLIAESIVMIVGLILSYKRNPSPHSFLVLCAFVLTLSTSSLRYCSALIYFYYFISKGEMDIVRTARTTAILSCFHITMLLSGVLALERRLAPIAMTVLCLGIFFEGSVLLGWRIEINYAETSTGLKSLAVALVPVLYMMMRQRLEKSTFLALYLVSLLSIFLVTSTTFFTFNRFLIIAALATMIVQWPKLRGLDYDFFDRGVVLTISTGIVAPYVIAVPQLYFAGQW